MRIKIFWKEMFNRSIFIGIILCFIALSIHAQERKYTRLKGYYRVYQATNSMLSYFVDGMMEFYIPLSDSTTNVSDSKKGSPFVDRKFLGSVAGKLLRQMVMILSYRCHCLIWNVGRYLRVSTVRNIPRVTMVTYTDGLINAER